MSLILLSAGVFVIALLYSIVGHAGASGYIALMTLAGFASGEVRPIALVLNILVASVGSWNFIRGGHFKMKTFWPYAVTAVPCAFLGGIMLLPGHLLNFCVAAVLLSSAIRFMLPSADSASPRPPVVFIALVVGAGLGFLSGLTGTGGGVFLTPLLLLMGWANVKQAAGISVVFILLNSLAGLAGFLTAGHPLPAQLVLLLLPAILGGFIGSTLGSRTFQPQVLRKVLAAVLVIAAFKLLQVSIQKPTKSSSENLRSSRPPVHLAGA